MRRLTYTVTVNVPDHFLRETDEGTRDFLVVGYIRAALKSHGGAYLPGDEYHDIGMRRFSVKRGPR